jgi:hypothetical protein
LVTASKSQSFLLNHPFFSHKTKGGIVFANYTAVLIELEKPFKAADPGCFIFSS